MPDPPRRHGNEGAGTLVHIGTWTLVHIGTWSLVHIGSWTLVHIGTWTLVHIGSWTQSGFVYRLSVANVFFFKRYLRHLPGPLGPQPYNPNIEVACVRAHLPARLHCVPLPAMRACLCACMHTCMPCPHAPALPLPSVPCVHACLRALPACLALLRGRERT